MNFSMDPFCADCGYRWMDPQSIYSAVNNLVYINFDFMDLQNDTTQVIWTVDYTNNTVNISPFISYPIFASFHSNFFLALS